MTTAAPKAKRKTSSPSSRTSSRPSRPRRRSPRPSTRPPKADPGAPLRLAWDPRDQCHPWPAPVRATILSLLVHSVRKANAPRHPRESARMTNRRRRLPKLDAPVFPHRAPCRVSRNHDRTRMRENEGSRPRMRHTFRSPARSTWTRTSSLARLFQGIRPDCRSTRREGRRSGSTNLHLLLELRDQALLLCPLDQPRARRRQAMRRNSPREMEVPPSEDLPLPTTPCMAR